MITLASPLIGEYTTIADEPDRLATAAELAATIAAARARGARRITIGSGRRPAEAATAHSLAVMWRTGGGEVVDTVDWPEKAASWLRQATRFRRESRRPVDRRRHRPRLGADDESAAVVDPVAPRSHHCHRHHATTTHTAADRHARREPRRPHRHHPSRRTVDPAGRHRTSRHSTIRHAMTAAHRHPLEPSNISGTP